MPFAEPWGSQERGEVPFREGDHLLCFQASLETNRSFFENPFPHFRVSSILSERVTGIVLTVLQDAFARRRKTACVGHLAGWQQCLNTVSWPLALGSDSSFPSAPEPEGALLCVCLHKLSSTPVAMGTLTHSRPIFPFC